MERQKLLQRIFSDLSAVFQKCPTNAKNRKVGSRSLFSTCLAKVPEYITEEQRRSRAYGPENKAENISDVYSQLEDFFSSGPPGSGWEPLREVVRYHVVHVLSGAGVIGLYNANPLLDFCIHQDAEDEAQIIHDSLVSYVNASTVDVLSNQGDGPKSFKNYFSHLRVLENLAMQTAQHGYDYQRMAQLLEEDRYVKSEWRLLWQLCISTITRVLKTLLLIISPAA